MTTGGATKVRIIKNTQKTPTIIPSLFNKSKSVIRIGLAERTWKITDILKKENYIKVKYLQFLHPRM